MRRFLITLSIISLILIPMSAAADVNETASELEFTINKDGSYTVKSELAPLTLLLSKIGETADVDIYVDSELRNRPVTIDVKNISLLQLLRRIAGENYAIVYNKSNILSLHVLSKGKDRSTENADTVSEFSGQVKISNNRAKMFFMPVENTESAVDDYIRKRHELLAKLASENPQKEFDAQISFKGYLPAEQIVALVRKNHLEPTTLNIGWKENGGGYDLRKGESVETAIESAAMHHKRFVEQLREDADMQVALLREQGMGDDQMKAELVFQQNADELNSVLVDKGVPFYGMRVAGTAEKLHALSTKDQGIRLVDPLWAGSVEDEISDVYPTTKIAIPLVPENETFIQQNMEK